MPRSGWEHLVLPVCVRALLLGRSDPWPSCRLWLWGFTGTRRRPHRGAGFDSLSGDHVTGLTTVAVSNPGHACSLGKEGPSSSGPSQDLQLPPFAAYLLVYTVSLRSINSGHWSTFLRPPRVQERRHLSAGGGNVRVISRKPGDSASRAEMC